MKVETIEYMGLAVLILVSLLLSTILSCGSYLVVLKQPDSEKVSVYECGFDPFVSSRLPFSVKFFLVGILFLVFDLEIAWLFPWCVVLSHLNFAGVCWMYLFVMVLTLGFLYEWINGGLDWQ